MKSIILFWRLSNKITLGPAFMALPHPQNPILRPFLAMPLAKCIVIQWLGFLNLNWIYSFIERTYIVAHSRALYNGMLMIYDIYNVEVMNIQWWSDEQSISLLAGLVFPISVCWAPLSRHPVESGWRCCWSHQTGGWPLPTQVATLPGHSHNQLTPIEFQDRGLNPILMSQWIQK